MIGRGLDAGMNFIDTADIASDGQAEVIVSSEDLRRPDEVSRPHKMAGLDAAEFGSGAPLARISHR